MSGIPNAPATAAPTLAGNRSVLSRGEITGFWAACTGWTLDGMASLIYAWY